MLRGSRSESGADPQPWVHREVDEPEDLRQGNRTNSVEDCGVWNQPAGTAGLLPHPRLAPYQGVVMSSVTGSEHGRITGAATAVLVVAAAIGALAPAAASAAPAAPHGTPAASSPAGTPDLERSVGYLVAPAQLKDGEYYESFPGFADFGLTIDGAFALAATGDDDTALKKITAFLDAGGTDGSGRTVDDWTLVGTPYASGGSIAKEAVLAEAVGADPHAFGGHDLIAALDQAVCAKATDDNSCAAAGSYQYGPSVFSQALGVIAQTRAGDSANAAAPVAYLEGLQNADGAWPSLIPATGDSDVDSTAMAVMALSLVPGDTASAAVHKGLAWIAAQQEADGGFPGAAGDSTNSAALAVQGLSLDKETYAPQITKALAFLAGEQSSDGGFTVAAGSGTGSDVRASAQVVSGATGISFGTLTRPLTGGTGGGGTGSPSPSTSGSPTPSASPTTTPSASATPTPTPTPTISTITGGVTGGDGGSLTGGDAGAGLTTSGGTGGLLAATGTDVRGAGIAAAALVAVGGATVLITRRRRPAGEGGR